MNTLHAHALPWVDEPLMVKNLFGGDEGLSDSGVSVSKLILNPFMFLEATGEMYQGSSALFKSYERSDVSWVGRLRGYRDVTESTNVDVGGSVAYGTNDAGPDFTTRLVGIDATVPLSSAAPRDLSPVPGAHGALLEPTRSGGRRRQRLRHVCQRRVPVRAPLVRRRALRLVASAPTMRRSSTRARRCC